MSDDKNNELIAEYQIIQGVITAASQSIIQVLGSSIAAIVALMLASLNTKTISPLWGVLFVTLFSVAFITNQTKAIVDAETYIDVFVEANLSSFRWKQRLFSNYNISKKKQFLIDNLFFQTLPDLHTL